MLTDKTNVEQHRSGSVFKRGLAHMQIGSFRQLSTLGYLGKRGGAQRYLAFVPAALASSFVRAEILRLPSHPAPR